MGENCISWDMSNKIYTITARQGVALLLWVAVCQQTIMISITVFRIMIGDTENRDHRKAPTPYTTQIQKEALESELHYLSYSQKDKGNPTSFCKVLSDLEKTEIKFPSPTKDTQTLSPDSSKREILKDAISKTQGSLCLSALVCGSRVRSTEISFGYH